MTPVEDEAPVHVDHALREARTVKDHLTVDRDSCPNCGALPCDWVDDPFATRAPAPIDNEALVEALERLANAEAAYRRSHDLHGDADRYTGRMWDLMRRAGDHARAILALPSIATRAQSAPVQSALVEEAIGALESSYVIMGGAFNRIHALPRTSDTELAERLEYARAKVADTLAKLKEGRA